MIEIVIFKKFANVPLFFVSSKAMHWPEIFGLSTFLVFRVSRSFDGQKYFEIFLSFRKPKTFPKPKLPKKLKSIKNWRYPSKIPANFASKSNKNGTNSTNFDRNFGLIFWILTVKTKTERDRKFCIQIFGFRLGFSQKSTGLQKS